MTWLTWRQFRPQVATALAALAGAATELRDKGTYGYLAGTAAGRRAVRRF